MSFLTDLVRVPTKVTTASMPTSSLLSNKPFSTNHITSPTKISSMPTFKPLDLGIPKGFSSIPKPSSIDFQAANPHPFTAPTKAVIPTFEPVKLTLLPHVTSSVKAPPIPSIKPAVPELASTHIPPIKPHVETALTPPVKFHDNPLSPVPNMNLGSVISHVRPDDFLPRVEVPRVETPRVDLPRSVVDLGHLLSPTRPRDGLPEVKPPRLDETPRIDLLNPGSRVDLADLFPHRPRLDDPHVNVKPPRIDEPIFTTPPRVRPNDFDSHFAARQAADEAERAAQMAFREALLVSSMPSLTSTPTSRVSSNPAQTASDAPEGQGTAFSAQTYAEDLAVREAFFAQQSKEQALTNRNVESEVMAHKTDVYNSENEYLTSAAEEQQWNKQRWNYSAATYDKPVLHLPLAHNFNTNAPVAQYA